MSDQTISSTAASKDPVHEALDKILNWSRNKLMWQRDALRRLCVQSELSELDKNEIYLLCRQDHNLPNKGEKRLEGQPFEIKHFKKLHIDHPIALKSIGCMENINALASDQALRFERAKLNVVYGDNGAGKSGYIRVLKRVCRARSWEDILHNVYKVKSHDKQSARIEYFEGDEKTQKFVWHGDNTDTKLLNISIFDSDCATVYVDEDNDLAYTPTLLLMLNQLSDLCLRYKDMLEEEIADLKINIQIPSKQHQFHHGTKSQQLIEKLSYQTRIENIKSLAKISKQEEYRIEQLKQNLRSDPQKEIEKIEKQKKRVLSLINFLNELELIFQPAKEGELRELLCSANTKEEAAQLAATKTFSSGILPQTGSDVWKELWEAARKFSMEGAYSDYKGFPKTVDGAVCVLCQQPLSNEAISRLIGFEEFVEGETQKQLKQAKLDIENWKKAIKSASIALITRDRKENVTLLLNEELDDPTLCLEVMNAFEEIVKYAQQLIEVTDPLQLKMASSIDVKKIPNLKTSLKRKSEKIEERIQELEKSSSQKERKKLQAELDELTDRVTLKGIQKEVEDEIALLTKINVFQEAKRATSTQSITKLATDISKILVTEKMIDAFKKEINDLQGITGQKIKLSQTSSSYGAVKFKPSLDSTLEAPVSKVLSEGEHQCIALAVFLAELSTAHNFSSIIFDDPVSSLDHNYRYLFADRLVQESKKGRQIIVFTHDLPFFMYFVEKKKEVDLHIQHVTYGQNGAGLTHCGVPYKGERALDIAKKSKKALEKARELHSNGHPAWDARAKDIITRLRDGWEQLAEEIVSPVVKRYNWKINVENLHQIPSLTPEDCETINKCYRFCHPYCHSRARETNPPAAHPDNIGAQIESLERLCAKYVLV